MIIFIIYRFRNSSNIEHTRGLLHGTIAPYMGMVERFGVAHIMNRINRHNGVLRLGQGNHVFNGHISPWGVTPAIGITGWRTVLELGSKLNISYGINYLPLVAEAKRDRMDNGVMDCQSYMAFSNTCWLP